MLLQIRDYIEKVGVVSTQQLTREFRVDFPALEPMLRLLVQKGYIGKCDAQSNCQSACFKCKTKSIEYYQILSH